MQNKGLWLIVLALVIVAGAVWGGAIYVGNRCPVEGDQEGLSWHPKTPSDDRVLRSLQDIASVAPKWGRESRQYLEEVQLNDQERNLGVRKAYKWHLIGGLESHFLEFSDRCSLKRYVRDTKRESDVQLFAASNFAGYAGKETCSYSVTMMLVDQSKDGFLALSKKQFAKHEALNLPDQRHDPLLARDIGEPSGQCTSGIAEGSWTYRYADGKAKATGEYRDGKKIGVWTFWTDGESRQIGKASFDDVDENGHPRVVDSSGPGKPMTQAFEDSGVADAIIGQITDKHSAH